MTNDKLNNNSIAKLLDKRSKLVLGIAVTFIVFSFIAPVIFVQDSILGINFMKTGPIGDTIGGIMNPFIALAGIFLTFLAFYIQVLANQQQRDSFRKELDEQKVQFSKNQFENQFYEMLRLHKENVNEISITLLSSYYSGKETVKFESKINGRETFKIFLNEITILYGVSKNIFKNENKDSWLNKAYHIFFQGITRDKNNKNITGNYGLFIEELLDIREQNKINNTTFNNKMHKFSINAERFNYLLFNGQSTLLAHYYRHLYQTVKFVANQDRLLDYSEKRKYLRILRAQLSNQEQAMLFYNWKSEFGANWENKDNHFFTDYRMIHNLYNDLLDSDFNLNEIFRLDEPIYYKTEINRKNDSLFEFQDWGNASE